ncbi:MAG: metallophosphoesterase [Microbacterium sp.]|uniref:metallophosphoesterase n=1 Tax=Microbacterium sp. TaxID=51671 RepID=UPI001AC4CF68|nr:metallophosphoesterase [Microbacterium sp.]MBN9214815.1 metallophosphoesterase [Microbacterium sp.]
MSRVLYTSDPHVTHPKLAQLRGFLAPDGSGDTAAHDAWYAEMWREHVTKRDTVYVLGDLTGGGTSARRAALGLFATLPGRKVFITGNHDEGHPAHRDSVKPGLQAEYLEAFDAVLPFALRRLTVDGERRHVALSHFPYFGDHTREDRFDEWRLKDTGKWLLHGHTHKPNQRVHDGRQIHVGVDAWGRPVAEAEIVDLIAAAEAGRTLELPHRQLISVTDAADAD